MKGRGKSKSNLKLLSTDPKSDLQTSGSLVCICADCNKIRDEKGRWRKAGRSLRKSRVEFTHGFCPDCLTQRYSEVEDFISMSQRR